MTALLARTIIDSPDGPAEIVTAARSPEDIASDLFPERLFETNVLSGTFTGGRQFYETLESAIAGHRAWVERHEGLANG